ncbi:molybdenum cofactor guanylyltransferase [Sphingorhabdus pulchriflava]|uniref:Molybdenum cofactor guanylyltransferase n=1 Tax=Sphingorhabdus pulchriflava TaxID=2292257 RepID=A0A371B4R6_9SPHN|nr:molybdenum cofactor guanylyltransferase [Sphingorhabdus pulchriflava]RDV02492.1 molybdenum cofactor guanylyltransferase [Sphingorhabdus pulchriflava]
MKLLGAILAGGQSRRFGSDKAEALYEGRALLDHVADVVRPQVTELVVAGREWPGLSKAADLPEAGIGPLGGLAGALDHAWRHDFDAVLSSGCDVIGIPADLAERLDAGPAIVADMPIVGLWPVSMREVLLDWLSDSANRSVYKFADHIGARRVELGTPLRNINRLDDLP